MVAKKIQKLVMEKMQPEINEAVANGATLEDIEAMIPKTHDEMVAYLGGTESLRGLIEASSFGRLNKDSNNNNHNESESESNQKKSIRASRSSIQATTKRLSATQSDAELEMDNESAAFSKPEAITDNRKRTIRSSRSSIQIHRGGMTALEAAEEAAFASEELIAMEQRGELTDEALASGGGGESGGKDNQRENGEKTNGA
jgi:hypothetical protein